MLRELTQSLPQGVALTPDQIAAAASALLDEGTPTGDKADFLRALSAKGETAGEITGFVRAFLLHAVRPPLDTAALDRPAIDVCGTGGDRLGLFNVSTTAMFILAAGGAAVVKHGNRGVTSPSGSADVLEALGGRIDLTPEAFAECVRRTGVAFMLAPKYHPAFKAVAPARQALAAGGRRTVFNLIGPLLNPVRPPFQLIGIFDAALVPVYARILADLGRQRAWAAHGATPDGSGMDEVSTLGPTLIGEARDGQVREWTLPTPSGLPPATLAQLAGGGAGANAEILESLLRGEIRGPKRDLAVLNAAAGLAVAGLAPDVEAGRARAEELLDAGRAWDALRAWRDFCRAQG